MESDKRTEQKSKNKSDLQKKSRLQPIIPVEYFKKHQCSIPGEKLSSYQIRGGKIQKCFLNMMTVNANDVRARNLFRSYAALSAEKHRHLKEFSLTIHPFSQFRFYAETFFFIILLGSNMKLTKHYVEPNPGFEHQLIYIMYGFDFLYILNILLNFFTGYVDGKTQKQTILNLDKIFCRYATTWLAVDLASIACVVPVIIGFDNVILNVVLDTFKILRLPTIFSYAKNFLTVVKAGKSTKTAAEILLLVIFYIIWNIFFQYALQYVKEDSFTPLNPTNCTWITMAGLWNETFQVRLVYSFERAVSMLRGTTNLEMLETNGCFRTKLLISWCISKFLILHCSLKYMIQLFGTDSAKAKYHMMTQQVQSYMNQKKLPPRLKKKIMKFYAIRFRSHFFVETYMMSCVSGELKDDIVMHTTSQLVVDVPLLRELPRSLLIQIGVKLTVVIFIAGDIIFKINTLGDCLYFVEKGTIAEYSESGKEVCHLEDGDYFGEIALVTKNKYRTTSMVAVTNCELFRLDKKDFDSTIACYPMVYEEIKKVATVRFEKTLVVDEQHKVEMMMRNEYNRNSVWDDEN